MSEAPPKLKSRSDDEMSIAEANAKFRQEHPELQADVDEPVPDPVSPDPSGGRAARRELFQPPGVDVGDIVRWHVHGASGPGVPAIVTRVNSNGTLALSVIKVSSPALDTLEKEAVMHADDPALVAKVHLRKAGYWTLSPREECLRKSIAVILDRLDRLESRVN